MVLHEMVRAQRDRFPSDVPCPNCGRPMQLRRSTADTAGVTEIHSYGCGECGLWTTADVEMPRGTYRAA